MTGASNFHIMLIFTSGCRAGVVPCAMDLLFPVLEFTIEQSLEVNNIYLHAIDHA